jgi:hypothetical protein
MSLKPVQDTGSEFFFLFPFVYKRPANGMMLHMNAKVSSNIHLNKTSSTKQAKKQELKWRTKDNISHY